MSLFSPEHHSFHKSATLFTNQTSNTVEHARTFSNGIKQSVFRTYLWSLTIMIIGDRRRRSRGRRRKRGVPLFSQNCVSGGIQRILPGRYHFFHKMNRVFHQKIGFTWETNPAVRDGPDSYLRPSPRPDGLEGPIPGADACQIRTTGQGG